jgi:hypothetical protein
MSGKPDINEVKNIASKYIKEMKINDADIIDKIMKIIEVGAFLKEYGRELKETVKAIDVEFIDKQTGKSDDKCKESSEPYVMVGDAEVVQINADENDENAQEISWGIPLYKEYSVKCVETESDIEYDTFIMRIKGCIADIKIIPKTPIVLIEAVEENSCWLDNKYYYLYIHPFGWWICDGLCD